MLARASLALICLAAVAAAPLTPIPQSTRPMESPAVIARFVETMRDNITLGKLPDGSPMQAETPAERAKPILAPAVAQDAFDTGMVSGGIEACGGDWQAMSYQPFTARLSRRGDLSPKQIGFAIMLHNAAQEQGNNIPEEECTPELRNRLATAARSVP